MLRSLFRPDTPVETFGLVPRVRCTAAAFLPVAALVLSFAFLAAVVAEPLLRVLP